MAENVLSPQERNARLWASLCHISSLVIFLGVPLGNIVGPLVCWLIKRNEHSFVDDQGKEALNFQLSLTVYVIAGGLIALLLGVGLVISGSAERFPATMGIPVLVLILLLLLALIDVVLVFIATIRASDGITYRYPLAIPFFR